jgi:hypothetical protein
MPIPATHSNNGIKLSASRGWIAESDDYADPHLLERLVGELDADANVALAYCRSWCVIEDNRLEQLGDWYLTIWNPHLWNADPRIGGR